MRRRQSGRSALSFNAAIGATRVTRVVIAHRPETIRSADRVIVLHRGWVIEDLAKANNRWTSRTGEPLQRVG